MRGHQRGSGLRGSTHSNDDDRSRAKNRRRRASSSSAYRGDDESECSDVSSLCSERQRPPRHPASASPGQGGDGRRRRRRPSRRRATKDRSSNDSVRSECSGDLDSLGESSRVSRSGRTGGTGTEATSTNSLVGPVGLNVNDIEVPGGLFNLARSGGDGDASDRPVHWQAARTPSDAESHCVRGARGMRSSLGSIDDDGPFVPLAGEGSYREFCAITSPVGGVDSSVVDIWSESDGSCTGSHVWDPMETEARLLTTLKEEQNKRRKLFVRRCAKAMVGLVALAALSMSVVYLIAEGGYESLIEFLQEVRSGRLFGGDSDSASDGQKEKLRHLESH